MGAAAPPVEDPDEHGRELTHELLDDEYAHSYEDLTMRLAFLRTFDSTCAVVRACLRARPYCCQWVLR